MSDSRFDTSESGQGRKTSPDGSRHSEYEMRLLDYLDGQLSQAEAKEVENHLRGCAPCREFRENWEQIDLGLMRREKPALSPGFEQRLWLRISERSPRPLETDTKLNLEAELRENWDTIRRGFLRSQTMRVLDYAGFALAAALGGYLVSAISLRALAGSPNGAGSLPQWTLQISSATGLVILLGSLALVARKRITNWIGSL